MSRAGATLLILFIVCGACGKSRPLTQDGGGGASGRGGAGTAGAGSAGNPGNAGAAGAAGSAGAAGGGAGTGGAGTGGTGRGGAGTGGAGTGGAGGNVSDVSCSAQPTCPCPTGVDLTICCTGGYCGWEGVVSGDCIASRRAGPGCLAIAAPPASPNGMLCPDGPGTGCAQGTGCPAALPATGDPCNGVSGRCHYCWPGGQPSGLSRSVECRSDRWADLGASMCFQMVSP